MKVSEDLVTILKNLQGINNSIWFPGGHEFRSRDLNKTIFVEVVVPESIPSMGIFDLSSLLQYFRMVREPEIEVEGDYLVVSGNGTRVKFTLAEKENLVIQEDAINIEEEPFARINFSTDILETIQTAKNIGQTKADTVEFEYEDGVAKVSIFNSESPTTNVVSKTIKCETLAKKFSMGFKTDQFVMLPINYELEMFTRSKNGNTIFMARFSNDVIKYVCPAKVQANNLVEI